MPQLKRNLVANYLGQGWSALMGLSFIPLYIQYLGMEAYGLIGLFAAMQAWLSLLDMGITPTLNREMARFTGGTHSPQSIRDLLCSLEVLCLSIAVLIGLGVWVASDYLASDWLKAEELEVTVVAQALSVMALVVALRFVEGIYRGSLFGLQRQVWFNGSNAIIASLRHGGAAVVLAWYSPTAQAFFFWQAFISLLSVAVFAGKVHRSLPRSPSPARFSIAALREVWRFAGGMMGITFLALLLTQVDKVLLSRLLTLELFGYYTLAGTVAGTLYMVIGPITQSIFPRMVECFTKDDQAALTLVYHQGSQLVTIMTVPAMLLLGFFAGGVVFMWSGDAALADNTAPILSVIVLGTFLNGLMWMPYQCQLAHGWTSLTLRVNIVAVLVLIPAILWVVPRYGVLGAAWIWVALNAGYVLIAVALMHRRLIPEEKWRWYLSDILRPGAGALGVILLARFFQPLSYESRFHWFMFLLAAGTVALIAATVFASRIRPLLWGLVGNRF